MLDIDNFFKTVIRDWSKLHKNNKRINCINCVISDLVYGTFYSCSKCPKYSLCVKNFKCKALI